MHNIDKAKEPETNDLKLTGLPCHFQNVNNVFWLFGKTYGHALSRKELYKT